MGLLTGCERSAPRAAAPELPWAGERVEGRPAHCLNLISRPENRRVERRKDGQRLSPLPCDRARCAMGRGPSLARYEGEELIVEVGDRAPLRIAGARVRDVTFSTSGAAVWQGSSHTVWFADLRSRWHGQHWQVPGVVEGETLVHLHHSEDEVTAVIGRMENCRPVAERRVSLAGTPCSDERRVIKDEDFRLVGELVKAETGWQVTFVSGEVVPLPAALGATEQSRLRYRFGWLLVEGDDGTFTHKAGQRPHLWAPDSDVELTPEGPRGIGRSGWITHVDAHGEEGFLLDVPNKHDMLGRPLPSNVFVERRDHTVTDDSTVLWAERLRDDSCVQHYRLYRADLVTGQVTLIAEGDGAITTPFLHEGVVHWIESDVRYEMVALQ
jgi:hypothetical protein